MPLTPELQSKYATLKSQLRQAKSVIVAFSGGVDSALVLAVAHSVLGERVLAVTAHSESVAQRERLAASRLARRLGVQHRSIATEEMQSGEYRANPVNRCFYCKSELYQQLQKVAHETGYAHIANGTNIDDLGDHRPGLLAAKEAGALSPLCDAGFTKQDVRDLARHLDLPVWNKPAMPCLSSRIPYGQAISEDKLAQVEKAEDMLIVMGFEQMRVRHFGDVAQIELPEEDIPRFTAMKGMEKILPGFLELGFKSVRLDPRGFRSGRLNESITQLITQNVKDKIECGKSS